VCIPQPGKVMRSSVKQLAIEERRIQSESVECFCTYQLSINVEDFHTLPFVVDFGGVHSVQFDVAFQLGLIVVSSVVVFHLETEDIFVSP